MTESFSESAQAALSILKGLLSAGDRQTRREQIPSLLELQTICREAGCDFADLNAFARVRDEGPALLLCGGDQEVAHVVARQVGFDIDFQTLPDAPLAWVVSHSSSPHLSLRRTDADRRVTRKVLAAFLQNDLKLDDFVFIEEHVKTQSPWRFAWVPQPKYLVELLSRSSALELITGQQASLVITDDTPEPALQLIRHLEQKHWKISRDQWDEMPRRSVVLEEIGAFMQEPEDSLEVHAVPLWNFVSERLVEQINRAKQSYNASVEQQEHKIRAIRQNLGQYQRNWSAGVHNLIDAHFQQRMSGKSFSAFMDIRLEGPNEQSFLSAAGLPAIFTKVEQFATDRMAEFIGGLEALALRMELHRITLGETNARWSPRSIKQRLESILTEHRVFEVRSEKAGGLMAKMTGKATAVADQRKTQLIQACRVVSRAISSDYAEWSAAFMTDFEQSVRLQLTAGLANQGLPDVERLRSAMEGFDRLSHRIQHFRESSRSSEIVAAEWLRQLASHRMIPLFQSR